MVSRALFADVGLVAKSAGRLRIHIPSLYRSEDAKAGIEAQLSAREHVIAAFANPLTGRVLILFSRALSADILLSELGASAQAPATPAVAWAQPVQAAPLIIERAPATDWHLLSADTAVTRLGSSRRSGLTQRAADERLRDGANTLSRQAPISSVEILLNQFKSLPVVLLGVSAALSLLTGGAAEALAIVAVLVMNGGIGFVTERRAEATIASLSELVDDIVPVVRDGKVRQLEAAHVVPGDLLVLAPGIRVAADVRLLETGGLSVDESPLTGESMPVTKTSAPLAAPATLGDRKNMAYRGTAVSTGTGLGVVVSTGDRTEVGAIQALTTSTERPRTPIQEQLDHLGNRLVGISCAACVGVFALGLLRGQRWLPMLKSAISLAIAAVPEGLPTVATTSLARGIGLMRNQNVLIRRLHSVEAIGAIQTICLDKTGTLTMNSMKAVALQAATGPLAADHDGCPELDRLMQVCILCNETAHESAPQEVPVSGSATESALLELAAGAGHSVIDVRAAHPLLSTSLRAEGRNYMRTEHAVEGAGTRLTAVKGSPDEVLALCGGYLDGAQAVELDAGVRARISHQNDHMARQQLRVLGFAFAESDAQDDRAPMLTWIGLVGLADPLRPGVERVISRFHEAGIRTVMLTGDQAATAYGIGKALHLNNGDELRIINSERLGDIAPELLPEVAERADIFSRVSPANKLHIVRALQQHGKLIAMTGDGINDGPALRAADVGIAMGSGTGVALSVADVALKDDRLDAILDAVSQGRTIALNIRKALHFLLSSNMSEMMLVAGSIALGAGQPLTPSQLLWVNLLSDVLPAIALAAEPPEQDVMRQPPRDAGKPIIGRPELLAYAREGGVLATGALAAHLYGLARYGAGQRAGTVAFNSLVLGQLLHALSCRSERHHAFIGPLQANRQLSLALGGSIGLQVLANLLPGLRRLLGMVPIGFLDVLVTLAAAGIPLAVNESAKRGSRPGPNVLVP